MSQIYIQRKLHFWTSQRWCVPITLNYHYLSTLLPLQVFIWNNKNTINVTPQWLRIWTWNCTWKGFEWKGFCGCFYLVISLSHTDLISARLILESPYPEWAQINNPGKEESVSWTSDISAACNTQHVFKPISSLPLRTPVQKANRTQLLKPKHIKCVGFGCALQVLCPASYSCRYWRINTAGIGAAQPRERENLLLLV